MKIQITTTIPTTTTTKKFAFLAILALLVSCCDSFSTSTKTRRVRESSLLLVTNMQRRYREGGETNSVINPTGNLVPKTRANAVRSDATELLSSIGVDKKFSSFPSSFVDVDEEEEASLITERIMGVVDDSSTNIPSVLTTALLVTGNTFGAGCLVVPEIAKGPGFGISSCLFLGVFVVNLISGLAIAEVAIEQYETSGNDVPSSFKEFAEESFTDASSMIDSSTIASGISAVSVFINSCIVIYDFSRAGILGEPLLGIDHTILSLGWAGIIAGLLATFSCNTLSVVASMIVSVTMISFSGLLIPGLLNVQDAMGTILAPGTDMSLQGGIATAGPIFLTIMVYQNIVPTVAKIQGYDRVRTVQSLLLGSFIPLLMYMAWCFCVLGGGIDTSTTLGGPLIAIFSFATIAGSSIGTGMSLSEEAEVFLKGIKKKDSNGVDDAKKREDFAVSFDDDNTGDQVFTLAGVCVALGIPITGMLAFAGSDLTQVLRIAGSFGSPLLYGLIPALMLYLQRKNNSILVMEGKQQKSQQDNLLPGGDLTLALLGGLSVAYVSEELLKSIGTMVG